jgi:hypothetical protein
MFKPKFKPTFKCRLYAHQDTRSRGKALARAQLRLELKPKTLPPMK